jgi:hypothetical protein
MRFVADGVWARQWDDLQDLAVFGRALIEVYDRDEVRSDVGFVSRPNK